MREVSGLVIETKPLAQTAPGTEVIRYRRGDIVKIGSHYAIIDGFFRNTRGHRCIRLGLPIDPRKATQLQQWGKNNPHRVKLLEAGHYIGD